MTIKWIGCSTSNYTAGREDKKVDKIVFHWMAGTLASTDATFNDGRRQVSAHYGIGQNEVHQYVKEEDTAWHAGNWEANQTSIGIEHEGGPDIPITEAVYKQSVELVVEICKRYSIPVDRDHFKKHSEYKATQCPGTLDIDRIIREVKLALEPAQISDDEKRALEYLKANKSEGNLEATVRRWKEEHDKYSGLENKARQLDGFIAKWTEEWKLPTSSNLVEVEKEMSKLLELEDRINVFRMSIEDCTGPFVTDDALLDAHKAIKTELGKLSAENDKLAQKLKDAKTPVGYKIVNSWDIRDWKLKLYRKAGEQNG